VSDPKLFYRPSDDHLVIREEGREDTAARASDLAGGRAIDPTFATAGIHRFMNFKEWQQKFAGRTIFYGSVDEAVNSVPRIQT